MERLFKKVGEKNVIQNVGEYIRKYLKEHPGERIYVGCDSEAYGSMSQYGIAICFHNPDYGKGVHFICSKETVRREHRINKDKKFAKEVIKKETFKKERKNPRKEEDWEINERLWGEVFRVEEVGDFLEKELEGVLKKYSREELKKMGYEENLNKLIDLSVDLNPVPLRKQKGIVKENKSNKLHDEALKYLNSKGFRVVTKPNAWPATVCADLVCRNFKKR